MESFFDRYRNLLVLLALLLAQIIGLAVQVRRTGEGRSTLDRGDGPGVRLIRLWAEGLVSPPERLIHSGSAQRAPAEPGLAENHRPPAPGAGRAS
jgi:rod shape-determining protein MreC